jgi:FKBP-type peptidyl-prolyl cis-trans isomerase
MRTLIPGLDALEECEGTGRAAQIGDTVVFDVRIYLNRGDEVPLGKSGQRTKLGTRRVIAGIEKALIGMRVGGYMKIRVSPHLAYGKAGVGGVVPGEAVLNISLWSREIQEPGEADPVRGFPGKRPVLRS